MDENTVKRIPRMRTAPNIVAEIKAMDPDSEVTEYFIRQLANSGKVPVVRAGNKKLMDLNAVLDVLRAGTDKPQASPPTVGGIRRVDEHIRSVRM